MRELQKKSIFGFLKTRENREGFFSSLLSSLLASFVFVMIGGIGTVVTGIFSYFYWLSYFKRLDIPMEFYKEANIPITDLVVTLLLALFFGFIIGVIILIGLYVLFAKIRHSKVLLIFSEVIFIIFTFTALFIATSLTFNVWPGCLSAFYIMLFLTGSYWHAVCLRQLSDFRFSRNAKRVGYVAFSMAAIILMLFTVFIYGGHKNRLATSDWYTEVRYCSEERKLKPGQTIRIILFETDNYYYAVEAEYRTFDSNNEGQIVVQELDHTLIDKGSVNTFSEFFHYINIVGQKKWMPPSDNMILFLICLIYCYIQLAALFIGWPTRTVTNKSSPKSNKSKQRYRKQSSVKSKEP